MFDPIVHKILQKKHFEIQINGIPYVYNIGDDNEYRPPFTHKKVEEVEKSEIHKLELIPNYHKDYKKNLSHFKKQLENFPNCCKIHERFSKHSSYDESIYKDGHLFVLNKIYDCYHHFVFYISHDDWFDKIIDYYDYIKFSFGRLPVGCGLPYGLEEFINGFVFLIQLKSHPLQVYQKYQERCDFLIKYIQEEFNSLTKIEDLSQRKEDLNDIYKRWKDSVPLSYINSEETLINLPDIAAFYKLKPRINQYLKAGVGKLEYLSDEELKIFLMDTTKRMLLFYNPKELYKQGKLTFDDSKAAELILTKHRIIQQNLLEDIEGIELSYFDKIIKWIDNEIKNIKELSQYSGLSNDNVKKLNSKVQTFYLIDFERKPEKLNALREMLEEKYIAKNQAVAFRKIFSGKAIENLEPVVWKGGIESLNYFIKLIHNKYRIISNTKRKHFEITYNCFVNEKSKKFDRSKLSNQQLPSTKNELDSIVLSVSKM